MDMNVLVLFLKQSVRDSWMLSVVQFMENETKFDRSGKDAHRGKQMVSVIRILQAIFTLLLFLLHILVKFLLNRWCNKNSNNNISKDKLSTVSVLWTLDKGTFNSD